jgi:hypothetical protein
MMLNCEVMQQNAFSQLNAPLIFCEVGGWQPVVLAVKKQLLTGRR